MALVATLCEIKWLQPLLNSLKVILPGPIHIFEDNQGAIDLAHNPSFHRRTKHVNIKYHVIREAVNDKFIIIVKVPAAINLSNGGTKALPRPAFITETELITGSTQIDYETYETLKRNTLV
jgi:hypothetical protein